MAFQLIPWFASAAAGSAIGSTVGAVVGTYWSTYFAPGFEPDKVVERYNAFLHRPRVRPIPDAIFDAWVHGRISDERAVWTLLMHGVPCQPVGDSQEVIARIAQQVGPGHPGGPAAVEALVRDGLNLDPGLTSMWAQMRDAHKSVPSATDWQNMRARGMASENEWSVGLLNAGADRSKWLETLPLYQVHPPIEVLMAATNRGFISDAYLDRKLQLHGISSATDRRTIDSLRNYLPPVGDIIRFSVREAFSPELANDLQLYDEQPPAAREMAAQQGMSWNVGFRIRRDGVETDATPFDLYWASHWLALSPGQIYDASHRLRPDRIAYYSEQVSRLMGQPTAVPAFTLQDANFWLRIADYPKSVRNQLLALSFAPLRLVDINAAVRFVLRDREWVIGQFLDRGLTPADAEFAADLAEARRDYEARAPQRNYLNRIANRAITDIVEGYATGMLSAEQAKDSLGRLGFSPAEQDTIVSRSDQRFRLDAWKGFIRTIRREYLGGIISDDEALSYLANAGVQGERRRQFVDRWRPLRYQRAARFTMPQILRHVAAGRMNPADAANRLSRLGFSQPDQLILGAEIRGVSLKVQSALAKAADLAASRRAKLLEQQAQKLRTAQRQIQADLRRITPLSTLKRWLVLGIRTEAYIRTRLLAQGYPPLEVASYILEWKLEAKKTRETTTGAAEEEASLQGSGTETTGSGRDGTGGPPGQK